MIVVKDAISLSWHLGALRELRAALLAQRKVATGPAGALLSNAIFSQARGEATLFIPCESTVRAIGSGHSAGGAGGGARDLRALWLAR